MKQTLAGPDYQNRWRMRTKEVWGQQNKTGNKRGYNTNPNTDEWQQHMYQNNLGSKVEAEASEAFSYFWLFKTGSLQLRCHHMVWPKSDENMMHGFNFHNLLTSCVICHCRMCQNSSTLLCSVNFFILIRDVKISWWDQRVFSAA